MAVDPRAQTRVGLFEVSGVHRVYGGVRFQVEDADGLFYSGGYLYLPDRPPPPDEEPVGAEAGQFDTYRHVDGPWYAWSYTFKS